MQRGRKQIAIATNAARAGSDEGVVRYVLGTSLTLAIIGLTCTWLSAALSMA